MTTLTKPLTFAEKLAALKAANAPAPTAEPAPPPAPIVVEKPLSFAEKLALAKAATPDAPTVAPTKIEAELAELAPVKPVAKQTFAEKLAAIKAQAELSPVVAPAVRLETERPKSLPEPIVEAPTTEELEELVYINDDGMIVFNTDDRKITLNEKQMLAVEYAKEGKSFCLTGAAGTGKTTAQAGVVWSLHNSGSFQTHDFKYIGNKPSIALVAFTKVAVRNMQKALRKNPLIEQYVDHCMTIHSLLEYEPVEYTEYDSVDGEYKDKWGFKPQRTAQNPLALTHLIIEEASMVDLLLWQNLFDALQQGVQIIFLGDINQLRPVFGDSILIYALGKLPTIELTEVYRTALESPIISNAHNILNGRSLVGSDCGHFNIVEGRNNLKVGQERMAEAMLANFRVLAEHDRYDPEVDMILSPWNKQAMGTKAINEGIATWLGIKRGAEVVEVRAGRNRWWLAVGDRVLVDKRLGTITAITDNPKYMGVVTVRGAYSRSGVPMIGAMAESADTQSMEDMLADYSDFKIADVEEDEGSRAASHKVSVTFADDDLAVEHSIESAGQFGEDKFQFGYCLTVHKAQGSEWPRVFMLLHWDHAVTATRELLYTAVTRAQEEFTIFGKAAVIDKAIARASFKGKTLQDKIAYFQAGTGFKDDVPLLSKLNH